MLIPKNGYSLFNSKRNKEKEIEKRGGWGTERVTRTD